MPQLEIWPRTLSAAVVMVALAFGVRSKVARHMQMDDLVRRSEDLLKRASEMRSYL